ncbi:MAG TPA: hypothetical protein PKA60_00200 [Candidatus Paceibacterota bacterium]|nr:hypothetical protein [Candidatus Paceibacterota bacterium]
MLKKINRKKEILYSVTLILVPLVLFFSAIFLLNPNQTETVVNDLQEQFVTPKNYFFDNINILARSAIVKDLNTGEIIYEKNSDIQLPLASITKVLTALTFEITSNAEYVQISSEDLLEYGDNFLSLGERFRRNDLINFMLLTSSNDSAAALASNSFGSYRSTSNDFVEKMNQVAKTANMNNSYFSNPTGLDKDANTAGAHGTARDVANLFEYTIKNYPHIMDQTKNESLKIISLNGYVHNIRNTNQSVGVLPNILASKTGFTDLAGGNLAVVIDPALNRPIVIVVLGSTNDGRFDDVKILSEKTIEYLKL